MVNSLFGKAGIASKNAGGAVLWAYDRLAEYLPKELRSNEGLSEAEVKLYGRLVETITEQVQHHFERSHTGSAHLPLEYFSDYSMTDLQVYSETLCELGILEPFKGMCIYVFCIPPKLAYSHAVAQLPRGPSLYKLLVSHLYLTIHQFGWPIALAGEAA